MKWVLNTTQVTLKAVMCNVCPVTCGLINLLNTLEYAVKRLVITCNRKDNNQQ